MIYPAVPIIIIIDVCSRSCKYRTSVQSESFVATFSWNFSTGPLSTEGLLLCGVDNGDNEIYKCKNHML